MNRTPKIIITVAGSLIIAFGAAAAFIVMRGGEAGFPLLAAGSYIGKIEGLRKYEGADSPQLFAHVVQNGSSYVFLGVLDPDWKAQLVSYESGSQNVSLMLRGPDAKYKLTGDQRGNLSAGGAIDSPESGESGRWRVAALAEYPALQTPAELQQLRTQVAAKARIREVNEQIKASELTVSQQKEEIAKLQHYITEGESLRRNADRKFKEKSEELRAIRQEVAGLKKEAESLVQKLELSQRLTGMGKLVSLARKSSERENRWIDSMLRTSVADVSLELDSQVERGEQILAIKNQIAEEHDRVFRLLQLQGAGQ